MSRNLTIVVGLAILVVLGGMVWIVTSLDAKSEWQVGSRTTSFGQAVAGDVSIRMERIVYK